MREIFFAVFLAVDFSYPALADQISVDHQKAAMLQKYVAQMGTENLAYIQRVFDTKSQYADDHDKLNDKLQALQTNHERKLENINNKENMELQKINEDIINSW